MTWGSTYPYILQMMSEPILITHCHLLTPFSEMPDGEILIEGGKITAMGPVGTLAGSRTRLDAEGRLAIPGLIDVHIQGAGGADVLDGQAEALTTIARTCPRFGVTGFLATTVYRPEGDNRHLEVTRDCYGLDWEGAELLGIHLEGPFISPGKRGMIQADCIAPPSEELISQVWACTGEALRMMTIAPELAGCGEVIRRLIEGGVVAAFGHSLADYEQTKRGLAQGISHVTHLFNAMQSMHHRQPGPLPALFEDQGVTAQVIPDGVHLHAAVLKQATRLLGPERVVLITDGMQAMGLPEGSYRYNGLDYGVKDGTARYLDGTLIGTALGLSQCLKRFVTLSGRSLPEAVRAASHNPARVLGLERSKGSLEPGKDADLVLLNRDLSVWKTMSRGRFIYQA